MPGGQSASVFGASFEVLDRSTGISISDLVVAALTAAGLIAFGAVGGGGCWGGDGLGGGKRSGFRSINGKGLKPDRRMLSMEKARGLEVDGRVEGGEA